MKATGEIVTLYGTIDSCVWVTTDFRQYCESELEFISCVWQNKEEKKVKNPFRTRYRARKYMLDVVHRVEYKRWWQRKWHTHSVYDTKEDALLALKRLKR